VDDEPSDMKLPACLIHSKGKPHLRLTRLVPMTDSGSLGLLR
jgi:hypothetical protein